MGCGMVVVAPVNVTVVSDGEDILWETKGTEYALSDDVTGDTFGAWIENNCGVKDVVTDGFIKSKKE